MAAPERVSIPRDPDDDYSDGAKSERLAFLREQTGASLDHVAGDPIEPPEAAGNVEHFIGAAQVPLGVAGPLLVNGEHARGQLYVPMAIAEGTLVASYNRGMRLLYEAGGVTVTVTEDHMQRAPSQVNVLNTRGKRVVAEAVIPDELMKRVTRSDTALMFRARQTSTLGGLMSGANNNGSHSANAITAIFIATGQDAANVAESSAALVHTELRDNGDYYYSITIPSLIVATYGGGTGLPTQRECLEMMDCYGKGKVLKLAEIVGATVLCGELSLGAAVVAEEWVDTHDLLGRNRP